MLAVAASAPRRPAGASAAGRVGASCDGAQDEDEALRATAREVFAAACRAVDPRVAVRNALTLQADVLGIAGQSIPLSHYDEIVVLGVGKASIGMAEAVEDTLGSRVTRGVVVTKDGHAAGHKLSGKFEVFEASHPTPNDRGVGATNRILEVAKAAGPRTLVLCCVSGGASALLCAPPGVISLADKKEATKQLLACGCPIEAKNAVLKHLSCVKGGQLLRAAHPAKVISMVLSDVVGDPLDIIGSGPTVPDPSTFTDCVKILQDHGIRDSFPKACLDYLLRGVDGEVADTPKEGDAVFQGATTMVVAGNKTAVDAAIAEAKALGFNTMALSTFMEGEAAELAKTWTALAKEELKFRRPVALPACIIGGGESTVTLPRKPGVGGRNQALALSAALGIQGLSGVALLAGGTDGGDGPDNDAAGAVVIGSDILDAAKAGLDARAYLQQCDSYNFFRRLEEAKYSRCNVLHLRDGPTGTNTADITVLLVRSA